MYKSTMKAFKDCYGMWALVAGAAEGIGESFTEALAKKGMNLVMVDINSVAMRTLAQKIRNQYHVDIKEITLDLSEKDVWVNCMKAIGELDCRLLVYVPAYSHVKPFYENSGEELDHYIDLNTRTPIQLIRAFTDQIKTGRPGGIILMSSLAGIKGPKYSAPYAATKAFSIMLSEGLFHEFRENGIDIMTCCAGMTDTSTFWSSKPEIRSKWPGVLDPEKVVSYALKKLGKKAVSIPGWKNRLSYFFLTRLLSRTFAIRLIAKSMEKIYPDRSSG